MDSHWNNQQRGHFVGIKKRRRRKKNSNINLTWLLLGCLILSTFYNQPTRILTHLANLCLLLSCLACSTCLEHFPPWFSCGWPISSFKPHLKYHLLKEASLCNNPSCLSLSNVFLQSTSHYLILYSFISFFAL